MQSALHSLGALLIRRTVCGTGAVVGPISMWACLTQSEMVHGQILTHTEDHQRRLRLAVAAWFWTAAAITVLGYSTILHVLRRVGRAKQREVVAAAAAAPASKV